MNKKAKCISARMLRALNMLVLAITEFKIEIKDVLIFCISILLWKKCLSNSLNLSTKYVNKLHKIQNFMYMSTYIILILAYKCSILVATDTSSIVVQHIMTSQEGLVCHIFWQKSIMWKKALIHHLFSCDIITEKWHFIFGGIILLLYFWGNILFFLPKSITFLI